MDKGKIIEQGTHKELLEKKGQYYRLWEMQQENFVIREDEIKEKQCEYSVESDDKGVMSYPRFINFYCKEKILVLVKVTIGVCTAATLYALGSCDLF